MSDTQVRSKPKERKPPPSADQKRQQLAGLCRALDTICSSWDDAVQAAESRGYPSQSPGPNAAAGVVKHDPNDPLHTRQSPGASTKSSAFGDQTGNAAMRDDPAAEWLTSARSHLLVLVGASGAEAGGERRWTGPFHPPALRGTFSRAAEDIVGMWPTNVAVLIESIHRLANVARVEWPPTLKMGTKVDDVVVGEKGNAVDPCTECGQPVAGTAADPIRRIDGSPYHAKSCYYRVYRRASA